MNKIKNILLTGATGSVGSYLLKILLENKNKVYVLARAKGNKCARDRVLDILRFWDEALIDKNLINNLHIIEGDITLPNLGMTSKKDIELLVSDVEVIFHSAAAIDFRMPLEMARKINVIGTRNVLDFALNCKKRGTLKKVNHISTAYIMGTKKNIYFSEDMLELGQDFYTTYEKTKYEAEILVKECLYESLDISVFRPGIVIGDSKEGKINDFRLFYQPLIFFSKEIYEQFPFSLECSHNLINVDTVAKAIFLLGDRSGPKIYNITSPQNTSILFCLRLASEYFGFKLPRFVPIEEFDFKKWTPVQKALAELYIPYFNNYDVKFMSQKTQDILKEYNFIYPEINKDNIIRNLAYCYKAGFVKNRLFNY